MKPLSPKTIPPERIWTWIDRAAGLMFQCPIPTFLAALPTILVMFLAASHGLSALFTLVLLFPMIHIMWWRATNAAFVHEKRPVVGTDAVPAGLSFSLSQAAIFAIIAVVLAIIGLPIHDLSVTMVTASTLVGIAVGSWAVLGYILVWPLVANGAAVAHAIEMARAADDLNRPVMTRLWLIVMIAALFPVINVVTAMLVPYIGYVAFRDIFLDIETDADKQTGTLVNA